MYVADQIMWNDYALTYYEKGPEYQLTKDGDIWEKAYYNKLPTFISKHMMLSLIHISEPTRPY